MLETRIHFECYYIYVDGFRPMMVTGATMKCPVGMLQVENRNIAMLSTTLNRKPEFQSVRRGCHGIVCMVCSQRMLADVCLPPSF